MAKPEKQLRHLPNLQQAGIRILREIPLSEPSEPHQLLIVLSEKPEIGRRLRHPLPLLATPRPSTRPAFVNEIYHARPTKPDSSLQPTKVTAVRRLFLAEVVLINPLQSNNLDLSHPNPELDHELGQLLAINQHDGGLKCRRIVHRVLAEGRRRDNRALTRTVPLQRTRAAKRASPASTHATARSSLPG